MALCIKAIFLLGRYQGGSADGTPERYPSPDRLYKALVSAAYKVHGFVGGIQDRMLDDAAIHEALSWLEGNPPTAIYLPASCRPTCDAVAYRDKGYVSDKKNPALRTVLPARATSSVSYRQSGDGDVLAWQWEQEPKAAVCDTLRALCHEIPYLGESTAPVQIGVESTQDYPIDGSLTLRNDLPMRDVVRAVTFAVPEVGRLEELNHSYDKVYCSRKKTIGEREAEQNLADSLPARSTEGSAFYMPAKRMESSLSAPWSMAIFIPARVDRNESGGEGWRVSESQSVAWAVAMHRFLVRAWSVSVTPMLTGRYQCRPIERPANNVAIHVVSDDWEGQTLGKLRDDIAARAPGFLLMLPCDMPKTDVEQLYALCGRSQERYVYCHGSIPRVQLGEPYMIDATQLWKSVPEGCQRYWAPRPLAMAETRAMPGRRGQRRWGAREAAALAVAHVWRSWTLGQRVSQISAGEQRYWDMVDTVLDEESPFRLYGWRPVYRNDLRHYVHKTDAGNVLRAMDGLIAIGGDHHELDNAAMAIGQARHLGGGLLVPIDLPESLIRHDDPFGKGTPLWM